MAGTTLIGYPAPLETLTPSGTGSEGKATGQRLAKAAGGRSPRSTASGRAALERPRGPSGKSRLPARAGLWGRRNQDGEIEPGSWHVAGAETEDTDLLPAHTQPSGRAILAVAVCVGLGVLGAVAAFTTRRPAPATRVNVPTPAVAPAEPVRTIVPAPEPRRARQEIPATASTERAAPAPSAPPAATPAAPRKTAPTRPGLGGHPPRQTPALAPEAARPSVPTPTRGAPPWASSEPRRAPPVARPADRTRPAPNRPALDPDAVLEPSF